MPNVERIRTRDTVSIRNACKPDASHRRTSTCWCIEGVVQAVYATHDFQHGVSVDIEYLPGRYVTAAVEFQEIRKYPYPPERRPVWYTTPGTPTVEWFDTHRRLRNDDSKQRTPNAA